MFRGCFAVKLCMPKAVREAEIDVVKELYDGDEALQSLMIV